MLKSLNAGALGAGIVLCAAQFTAAQAAWEPTRPVEFIVPAGTGGGADQMARTIQGIVTKHNLMKQSMVVINKAGGAGGEGFLDVKNSKGNPHKLVITLSNLFTTPLATGIPFNWKDLTPVAMLALDEFVLWVNAEKPYKTAKDYIDAVKKAQRQLQDGRHRLQAGRPDHHGRDREGDRRQVHLHSVQGRRRGGGAARRQSRRFDRQQSDRGGRAVARRQAPAALRVRRQAARLSRQDRRRPVLEQHPDLQVAGPRHRVSDAARHLHDARRDARIRSTTTSTCSRRCARRRNGRS